MEYKDLPAAISTLNGRQDAFSRAEAEFADDIVRYQRSCPDKHPTTQVNCGGYTLVVKTSNLIELIKKQKAEDAKELEELRQHNDVLRKVAAGLLK